MKETIFRIGSRTIGRQHPVFIIAEVGINHNGDVDVSKRMIDAAKSCGADAVKFQTFSAGEFISDRAETYTYCSEGAEITESMYEMFKRYEFSTSDWNEIFNYCKKKEIIAFSTPQNPSDLDVLLSITNLPAIKVGSDDLTNPMILKYYASKDIPMIISSGMAHFSEIAEAVETVLRDNRQLALLHCVSSYPADFEDANLPKIRILMRSFPGVTIGFSDHTEGITAALGAVALGARIIEKHFTLDNNLPGPDHRFSADPKQLLSMVKEVRHLEKAMVPRGVAPTDKELEMRELCRRSLVANRDIQPGEKVQIRHIACKRPGLGLPPKFGEFFVGRRAKKVIQKDSLLVLRDFE